MHSGALGLLSLVLCDLRATQGGPLGLHVMQVAPGLCLHIEGQANLASQNTGASLDEARVDATSRRHAATPETNNEIKFRNNTYMHNKIK